MRLLIMSESQLQPPADGQKIEYRADGGLEVSDRPIVCFIEGDGIGVDITPVMRSCVDAAVAKAYGGKRALAWMELYAGEKAQERYGADQPLPEETLAALAEYKVGIKGPLGTPVGGGLRSLNVAIRQRLQLYACVRPVRYFEGIQSQLKHPERTDMVIFRENTEDIYLGIEFAYDSPEAQRLVKVLRDDFGVESLPFPASSALGIKPISKEGSERLIRRALQYALDNNRRSVTLVHKGNIMKYTEGAFLNFGYELAKREFGAVEIDGGPWLRIARDGGEDLVVKDVIADNFLQKIIIDAPDYDVVATMNLNGDYISDALAAQVGGIGIAPGANLSDKCAVFEATHGTAPKHTGKDDTNPGSLLLSAAMMLEHLGWTEACELLTAGMAKAIREGTVTYDLAKGRPEATTVPSSAFGKAIVANIEAT